MTIDVKLNGSTANRRRVEVRRIFLQRRGNGLGCLCRSIRSGDKSEHAVAGIGLPNLTLVDSAAPVEINLQIEGAAPLRRIVAIVPKAPWR